METTLVRPCRGLITLLRRRGARYVGYLLSGVVWPKFAYRFAWGPRAPRVARSLFYAVLMLTTSAPDFADGDFVGWSAPAREVRESAAAGPDEVEAAMDRAHRAGVTGVRNAFGLARRMPDGTARFEALPGSRYHHRRDVFFAAERDRDRVAFNEWFGASVLTEDAARSELRARTARVPMPYRHYAPIDFSGGLTVGSIASTDSGTGRWDFFNRAVVAPLVTGKRVVDLGCNNGSMTLMMLRAGAAGVTGIELTPSIAELARLNARILAWRDLRSYDVRIITGDMRLFLTEPLGQIDVVTAFCSLYYLPEADIRRVIRKAAGLGARIVVQSNEAIQNLPARARQLRSLIADSGYAAVDLYEARGFSRHILVGHLVGHA